MHLTTETAFDLLDGRLDKEEEVFWTGHVKTCDTCADDVLQLRQLQIDLKRQHLINASERDLETALHIFPLAKRQTDSSVRSVVARIVFNSFLQPATAGIRGTSPEPVYQFVLRDEEFDIHIKIWGDEKNRQIRGQLLPRSGTEFVQAAECHLLYKGARLQSTTTDETGEFQFTDVPEGDLNLQVDLPGLTIVGSLNIQDTEH
jgi:hypothetical protein